MRILIDTNVILDVFLDREPFVDDAALIWKAHEEERLTAYVSAITPINIIEDFDSARLPVFAPADFIKEHQEIFEKLVLD